MRRVKTAKQDGINSSDDCTDYLLREPNYFIFGRNERFTSKPLLAIFISFGIVPAGAEASFLADKNSTKLCQTKSASI